MDAGDDGHGITLQPVLVPTLRYRHPSPSYRHGLEAGRTSRHDAVDRSRHLPESSFIRLECRGDSRTSDTALACSMPLLTGARPAVWACSKARAASVVAAARRNTCRHDPPHRAPCCFGPPAEDLRASREVLRRHRVVAPGCRPWMCVRRSAASRCRGVAFRPRPRCAGRPDESLTSYIGVIMDQVFDMKISGSRSVLHASPDRAGEARSRESTTSVEPVAAHRPRRC